MRRSFFASLAIVVVTIFTLTACGGGGSTDSTSNPQTTPQDSTNALGLNNAKTITGTTLSGGGDPIPGATIFVPTVTVKGFSKVTRTTLKNVTSSDGTSCDDPQTTSCASTCTGTNGTFTLDVSACPGSSSQLVMQKGNLQKVISLNCSGDAICNLTSSEGTFGIGGTTTYPKVAVVTGNWDTMQDVLAKIAPDAYGAVGSSSHRLEGGEENKSNLTFIIRDDTLYNSDEYVTFDKYLNGTKSLSDFDIVFINCGGSLGSDPGTDFESLLSNADVRQRLVDYVNNGGTLYVTDLSYDFINQSFPDFVNFEGNIDPTHAGNINLAQNGYGGEKPDATVKDATMASWLKNVTVNANTANNGPGRPDDDCTYSSEDTYTQFTGALDGSGKIPLGDFGGGWALMTSLWPGSTSKLWISADIDEVTDRPLTVSKDVGNGRLFYSSYHTADACPSAGFWPQERVLQYLIFEAF